MIMALKKLDLFDLDVMADGGPETLRKIQNVCRLCGYNFWTHVPAQVMGIARIIKYKYKGHIPRAPEVLITWLGIARKVCMLILQDGFPNERHFRGIVMDRHVFAACKNMGWLQKFTKAGQDESRAAQLLEASLPTRYFKDLNEVTAGTRQLYSNTKNLPLMLEAAQELGCEGLIHKITKAADTKSYEDEVAQHPKWLKGLTEFLAQQQPEQQWAVI